MHRARGTAYVAWVPVTRYGYCRLFRRDGTVVTFSLVMAANLEQFVKLMAWLPFLGTSSSHDALAMEPAVFRLHRLAALLVCAFAAYIVLKRFLGFRARRAWRQQQQQPSAVDCDAPALQQRAMDKPDAAKLSKQLEMPATAPTAHPTVHDSCSSPVAAVIAAPKVSAGPAPAAPNSNIHDATHNSPTSASLPRPTVNTSVISQQQQQQHSDGRPKRISALYRSPVVRQTVSIKLNKPPSTDASELEKFNYQLASAVQAAVLAALKQSSAAAAPYAQQQQQQQQQQYMPLVSDVTSFLGCYQVVMHVSLLRDLQQQLSDLQQQQLLLQHVDKEIDQLLAGWSDLQLVSTTLLPDQQQESKVEQIKQQQHWQQRSEVEQHRSCTSPSADHAAATAAAAGAAAVRSTADGSEQHVAREDSTSLVILPGFEGICLSPAVSALPSLSSSSPAAAAAAGQEDEVEILVDLHLPAAVVRQLHVAGHDTVRVVVSEQSVCGNAVSDQMPSSRPLLDRNYQLQPAAAAAGVTAADRSADAANPLSLELRLRVQMSMQQQQQWMVLSVVTLAAGKQSATAAAAAATAGVCSRQDLHEPSLIPQHAVIAKLPLLLLPPGPAAELQQLSKDSSVDLDQEVLPLLLDLAAVLGSSSSSSKGHDSMVLQDGPRELIIRSLLSYFVDHGLLECQKLLLTAITDSSDRSPILLSVEQHLQQQQQHSTAAASTAVSCVTNKPHIDADLSSPVHRSGSSSSSSSEQPLKPHKGRTSSGQPLGSSRAQGFDNIPVSDLEITLRSVTCGFRSPAAEAAYQQYKGTVLSRQDYYNMVLHAIGAIFVMLRLITMTFSSKHTWDEIITLALRGQFVIFHTIFSGIVWAATAFPTSRFSSLQRYRGLVLLGGMMLVLLVTAIEYHSGGVVGSATRAVFEQHLDTPKFLLLFRHVLQPILACAGVCPMTVVYLFIQVFVFDNVFGYMSAFGLGVAGTAGLIVVVHLGVATFLEYHMRRNFVRRVATRV